MAVEVGDGAYTHQSRQPQYQQQNQQSVSAVQSGESSGFRLMNRPEVTRAAEQKNLQGTNPGNKPCKPWTKSTDHSTKYKYYSNQDMKISPFHTPTFRSTSFNAPSSCNRLRHFSIDSSIPPLISSS